MKQLTVGDSFNGFLNSLKVRKDIKIMSDEELYNYIFEVFLGDIVAYLSPYTLDRLEAEGIIDEDIYAMSKNLRNELLEMINGPSWNIASVKSSDEWANTFEGLKKLDALVHKKWTEEEISYLKNRFKLL
ncbi:hypothetical protein IA933_02685 [Listeria marthii]|uniref:hypothetical protein n=1 Tax=Listeria marthii TaxID=529731 RepID=UPI0018871706|nr:hypothetical protein [Listeria marthii]MBF2587800.1 hypothetical protein [Listeria marthii]